MTQRTGGVNVTQKMRNWIAHYIRSHRKNGSISIDVKTSCFNDDFFREFGVSPRTVIHQLIREGFLEGADRPAVGRKKASFGIWLVEDKGKGKGNQPKPILYRKIPTTSEKIVDEAETSEEERTDMASDKIVAHYAYEKIPHPVTGVVDVLKLIQHIHEYFCGNMTKDATKDGHYWFSSISITVLMSECGIPDGQRPELSRIMQQMGLLKRQGHGRQAVWGVLDRQVMPFFISVKQYKIAQLEMNVRTSRSNELSRLRRRLENISESASDVRSSASKTVDTSSPSFEEEALEALLEAERLANELEEAKAEIQSAHGKIAELQAELKQRPTGAEATRQALAERLAELRRTK